MSDTFLKVNGYISSATTIVKSWLLLPIKTLEIAEPADTGILGTINSGLTAISISSACIYQYNKYVKLAEVAKWLIFSFVIAHIIVVGGLVYLLFKQEGVFVKVNYGVTRYLLPIVFVAMGGVNIWMMVTSDKSAYRILNTINNFSGLADFGPIFEPMKTQPEVYFPVQAVRVLLQSAEGATLLIELVEAEEVAPTQPASA
jgi:hypothetical protein